MVGWFVDLFIGGMFGRWLGLGVVGGFAGWLVGG
jgi:hypothetical protein